MSTALFFSYILEDDKSKFLNLTDAKKFDLLLQMVKRKSIKNYQDMEKSLKVVGWENKDFLNTFKNLWDSKKIGWQELDMLDNNDHLFRGPGLITDRWLTTNIGDKEICDRIPNKDWDNIPYCKALKNRNNV